MTWNERRVRSGFGLRHTHIRTRAGQTMDSGRLRVELDGHTLAGRLAPDNTDVDFVGNKSRRRPLQTNRAITTPASSRHIPPRSISAVDWAYRFLGLRFGMRVSFTVLWAFNCTSQSASTSATSRADW